MLRSSKLKAYRFRLKERLGIISFAPLEHCLWVHAVSVGEAIAAVPIIKKFAKAHPDYPIVVTTMTPTGSERVREAFKDSLNKTIFNSYIPYDVPQFINRFIRHTQPKLFVAMETELWPNLLNCLGKADVPILIANGRLSPHSFKWYKRLGQVMKNILKPVSHVAAQSEMDAKRFEGIGVQSKDVTNVGNIKFDFEFPLSAIEQGKQLKEMLKGPVLIAASTHEGEEKKLFKVYANLLKKYPTLKLILVPRHPDRFEAVAVLCQQTGFEVTRRSQGQPTSSTQIYLGDTMGEMMTMYAASDVAFVGGSLVPVGGHNLLEPAALSLPVVTGKYLFNFLPITKLLQSAQAVEVVQDEAELEQVLSLLLSSTERCHQLGESAKGVVSQNQGALDRLYAIMMGLWKNQVSP